MIITFVQFVFVIECLVWARGKIPFPLSLHFPNFYSIFSIFNFSPSYSLCLFSCFSIPSYSTRTVRLHFQAGCHWRRLNLAVVFSERTTLRSLYAISHPSVVCLSSVCLWRWCTLLRRLNFSAIFFHHTIAQGLYFSGAKNRWWGTPLSPEIFVQSDRPPFQIAKFRPISAYSASTVIASEKKFN